MGTVRWLEAVQIRTIAGYVAHLSIENCRPAATGLAIEAGEINLPGLLFYAERMSDAWQPSDVAQKTSPLTSRRSGPHGRAGGLLTSVNAKPPLRDIPAAPPEVPLHTPDMRPSATVHLSPLGEQAAPAPPDMVASDTAADPNKISAGADIDRVHGNGDWNVADAATAQDALQSSTDDEETVVEFDAEFTGEPIGPQLGEIAPETPSLLERITTGATSALVVGYTRSRELMGGMLPDREATTPSVNRYRPSAQATASAATQRRPVYADVSERIHEAVAAAPVFAPPAPAAGGRQRLFVLLAILILVLVPTIVYTVANVVTSESDLSRGQNLLDMAQVRVDNGLLALDSDDVEIARSMCLDAQSLLVEGSAISGRSERTAIMSEEIERCLNATMDTEYLFELAEPMVRFSADAEPQRVLVADEHIFVLDTGRQLVEHYQMDGARQFVPDRVPLVAVAEGQVIDGVTVGRLVDMAWQPIVAGYQERPSLIVLDRNNHLFRFDPRVEGATHVPLAQPAPLQAPNQMEVYLGRTYISDEGLNQILRYNAGRLDEQPEPWFDAEANPDLAGVIRMAIDGDIWLLYNRGSLIRYSVGLQSPFSLGGGSVVAGQAVDMVLGDEVYASIYVADAAQERILVFDKATGAYDFQWVAPEGDPLRDLRGLFIEPIDGNLYILTKSSLYQHPLRN